MQPHVTSVPIEQYALHTKHFRVGDFVVFFFNPSCFGSAIFTGCLPIGYSTGFEKCQKIAFLKCPKLKTPLKHNKHLMFF
ncbi:hypothetical protein GDO78_000951 [Eleutherodactylus coqui]|uniref:Uncharacterized protein n=1 Tax=Eleutherodactylus coqui TaxID=57060 RepID=A0A8J6KHT4_ELECQ|nr:hypothetical protein GDO78_000951 [Eleutherodactylus coqui]